MVLVSKADLLGPSDRQKTVNYVRRHLLSEINLDLPVHLVSVMVPDAQLCDQWFENELKPLLESHREATATSLKRKIGLLREAVMDTFRARLDAASGSSASQPTEDSARAAEALRGASVILEAAEKEGRTLGYNTRGLAPAALKTSRD